MSSAEGQLRSFGMSTLQIADDLKRLDDKFGISLGHTEGMRSESATYYPQFDELIRSQAKEMAAHYELFYCLEQSIRQLIISALFDKASANWWKETVPTKIVEDVEGRLQRERDSGFSLRSDQEIDYTNFGELSVIILQTGMCSGLFSPAKGLLSE